MNKMAAIKIRTRFPPEPNGYLHLGHLKSIYNNYNYEHDGVKTECHIRLDDTNPRTETQEFVDEILQDVKWLGYHTDGVTYTSDYFGKLIVYATQLVDQGLAYVDFSTGEEIHKQRRDKVDSPYRNTSVDVNKKEFAKMVNRKYKEGKAVLRLKIPEEERTNECMIDPIAYRIIMKPHYKTGEVYCVYPSYEFSHYIVDSLEGITHSFCTLEFYVRRNLSYWVLEKLGLKKPIIEETNRLETNFGTLSKRKIKKMIEDGSHANGWDDPRLLTIRGLRNKGFSPELLLEFCKTLHYTNHTKTVIPEHKFNSVIRDHLESRAPRRMAVLNPLKINLVNWTSSITTSVEKPLFPGDEKSSKVTVEIDPNALFIEKEDFKESANKKYRRLVPGRAVRLKYFGIIVYQNHDFISENSDPSVSCNFYSEGEYKQRRIDDPTNNPKISGTIHWVSNSKKVTLQTATYDGELTSRDILMDSIDENGVKYWQFERLGFFHVNGNHISTLVDMKRYK